MTCILNADANSSTRTIAQEQSAKEADLERRIESTRAQFAVKETQYQNELAQVKKSANSEAERVKLRAEAEAADLKASINRLEVDLMKVWGIASNGQMKNVCANREHIGSQI